MKVKSILTSKKFPLEIYHQNCVTDCYGDKHLSYPLPSTYLPWTSLKIKNLAYQPLGILLLNLLTLAKRRDEEEKMWTPAQLLFQIDTEALINKKDLCSRVHRFLLQGD